MGLALLVVHLDGCVSPRLAFDRNASELGLARQDVSGRGFLHAVYHKADEDFRAGGLIHVYLAGDGTPYVRPGLIAADPTPRRPVVLKLMALDPNPALLIGRPCYHGYADSPPCSPHFWTDGRYSEEIVASMTGALAETVPPERELVLIGFSGGGSLAVLLAGRVSGVVAVVTLAGNLDINAWTDLHGYARLRASLNPAAASPLADGLAQLHYAGAKDARVPPELLADALAYSGGKLIILPNVGHNRGWKRVWPGILTELERQLRHRDPTTERSRGGDQAAPVRTPY